MKGLDREQEAPPQEGGSKLVEADLKIAVALSKKAMSEGGGLEMLKKALGSTQDPAQVVSKFLVQLTMKVKDLVAQEGVELSPEIVLAKNGWIVQMLDYVETQLKLPPEFSDEILQDVMETFQAMSMETKQEGAPPQGGQPPMQGQAPMQGPPPPQAGVM